MDQTRKDFLHTSAILAGTAGLTLRDTDALAASATAAPTPAKPERFAPGTENEAADLAPAAAPSVGPLTTNVGLPIGTDQNSLPPLSPHFL